MENKIIEMIAKILNKDISQVKLESNFVKDLNADSLDILDMLFALEQEFELVIKDDDVASIKTVSDIVEYIKKNK